ncbi:hypothetical protein HMPREF0620_1649 [Parascardovia denticolens DSM 10105 = JCM 12538]|uniref:Uncharacterized protein n=1 Tax=Parascardovia denticolens DSM 10105 = JCM 12538 TaxID=864564 RepID=E6K2H6_PARDN|nr:hypothetical protein HMPREF0620_1649 [Parascardovia denticolens DSM 10105 = JCM 12538]
MIASLSYPRCDFLLHADFDGSCALLSHFSYPPPRGLPASDE